MVMPGETISTGADKTCEDCGDTPEMEVILSANGRYYIGTTCNCGPYSRETTYYSNKWVAEVDLETWKATGHEPKSVRR